MTSEHAIAAEGFVLYYGAAGNLYRYKCECGMEFSARTRGMAAKAFGQHIIYERRLRSLIEPRSSARRPAPVPTYESSIRTETS